MNVIITALKDSRYQVIVTSVVATHPEIGNQNSQQHEGKRDARTRRNAISR